jgi:hypothetical protein
MGNTLSPTPLMPCGLQPVDHRTPYHTSVALQRYGITSNPCVHADFRAFSGIFSGGLQKTNPESIYPPPLPDAQSFVSLYKKTLFFGHGLGSGHTITITSTKKIKIQKTKNLTEVWKIRKFYENYKFHRNLKVLGKLQISREFQGPGKTVKVPGNFSYPEFPDNSILSTIEKRKFQHASGVLRVSVDPSNTTDET